VRGLPGQIAAHFIGAGDQDGGIAGTAGEEFFGDVAAGEAAGGGEDFADGVAGAGADVEGGAGDAGESLEGAQMGLRDVEDVDVIADAGAVGSGIVVAKNGDVGGAGLDSLQNQGNEMRFMAAGFAAIAGGAGDVEITEGDVIQAGVTAIVGEDVFKGELGFAVGIDGQFGMVLGDGDDVGLAVDGAGGREDEVLDAMAKHGVDEEDAAGDVGDVERAGVVDGFFYEGFAGEVHYGVDGMAAEDFVEGGGIGEVGLVEESLRGDGGAVAFAEVVEGDDVDAGGDEELGADAADVAGGSGDENVQGRGSWRQ